MVSPLHYKSSKYFSAKRFWNFVNIDACFGPTCHVVEHSRTDGKNRKSPSTKKLITPHYRSSFLVGKRADVMPRHWITENSFRTPLGIGRSKNLSHSMRPVPLTSIHYDFKSYLSDESDGEIILIGPEETNQHTLLWVDVYQSNNTFYFFS